MISSRGIPWHYILVVHSVVFLAIFLPILVNGAFFAKCAMGFVFPDAVFYGRYLFSWDVFWNDMSGHGFSMTLTSAYLMQPLFVLFLALFAPVDATTIVIVVHTIVAASLASVFLQREQYHPWASVADGALYAMVTWL